MHPDEGGHPGHVGHHLRRDLLRGERLEGLGDEVRVGADHLLPTGRLHDVRHVVRVDEVDGGRLGLKSGLTRIMNVLYNARRVTSLRCKLTLSWSAE